MGMDIIPSESGSDRSSSAASDCCSPEISGGRLSDQPSHVSANGRQSTPLPHGSGSNGGGGGGGGPNGAGSKQSQKTQPNGTPLDALFQMTNKSFEEAQGDNGTGSFLDIYWFYFLGSEELLCWCVLYIRDKSAKPNP